jgi:hypothetical protein
VALFRGVHKELARAPSVTEPGRASQGVALRFRVLTCPASGRIGSPLPSCPWAFAWASGYSLSTPLAFAKARANHLSCACALLQSPSSSHGHPTRVARHFTRKLRRNHAAWMTASLEVPFPFNVSPHIAAASWTRLPHVPACALRFSRPLGAFIRVVPAGLVSYRIRSWGCTLQSLPPHVQPYAVSGALPLSPFPIPHQLAVTPPKRLYLPTGPKRLGLRGLLHTRVRHSNSSCLGCRRARSSHGFRALQGVLPHRRARAFTRAPLMGFLRTGANDRTNYPPGFRLR